MAAENAMPRVLVFGEALTDFVHRGDSQWRSVAGGSCWNVARVASRLGVASAWCGAVSQDLFGQQILELSREAGLDMRFAQAVDKPPLIAMVHRTHPPAYFFLGTDTADLAFDETQLPAGWESHCEIAHFGCISLVRQPLGARLLSIAERLKARGVRISFDPNYRNLMGADYPALFERLIAIADLIKISDEDLSAIYPQIETGAAIARVRELASPDSMLVYTRGAAGLTLYRGAQQIEQSAFAVDVADTVGAGDSCIGGFIASLLSKPQADAVEHLRFAAATAATVCQHSGAYAPSVDEVEQLMATTKPA
jgi:fructokinase